MASYTDSLVAFNPYVQEIPVDDFVRVGLYKQQQYDQGVQKVQSYIESVAGIEVVKAEHKDYLAKRVNQLEGEVSKIASEDFSNQQLVNSVGTLTSKIAADPIINNAQLSTQRYKQGVSAMKKAQGEGKSAASNDWYFQKQANDWLSDQDITSSFNGSYTEYTDVNKKAVEAIKLIDPSSTLEQIPYKRGANGQVMVGRDGLPEIDFAMIQKSAKGVTSKQVEAAIRATMDSKDLHQLRMDGAYNYRSADKFAMRGFTDDSYNYRIDQVNSAIKGLLVERQTNQSDPNFINQIDAQIASLQDVAEKYKSDYSRDIDHLNADPEGYKAELYTQSWLSRYGSGFAYAENSLEYKENPYFMAAERRRENDIKYQEFLINKQFQAADLEIKRADLDIRRQQLDINRMNAQARLKKAGVGDDGSPLVLTGSAVREPIDQEDLENINADEFLGETEEMSEQVDTQRMSLLAQIRPDLVNIVRNPDGTTKRYEYQVSGKDPNVVKTEAEASLLRIKEAYDRGEAVDDGAKTYFDNLANTSLRVDNRKAAIGGLMTEADKTWSMKPIMDRMKPFVVTTQAGDKYTMSPKEQIDFNEKMKSVVKGTPSMGVGGAGGLVYDDALAAKIFVTPAEQYMYRLMKNQRGLEGNDLKMVEDMFKVAQTVNVPARTVLSGRKEFMTNAVKDISTVTQPVSFVVEAFKPDDRGNVQGTIANIFNSTVAAGKENTNPNYDEDDISSMINKTNAANTTYSLVSKGGDRYALRMSNTTITDKPREMDITKDQAQDLFGAGKFLDDFQAIREALQLTRGKGRVTTDVQGMGRGTAFSLNNGNIRNYGVKYHVEEPLKNGGLQVRLYLYDKAEKKWEERTANFGRLLNEAQVTKMLSSLTDIQIDNLLGKNK
jgi:hypothetical protein